MSGDLTKKRVVYELPDMPDVTVRSDEGMDLYSPSQSGAGPLPAVIIVAGYPDEGFQRMLGCRFKEMESVRSWAKLIAGSGMAAVTYSNSVYSSVEVAERLRDMAQIDGERIGLWASSGNAPLALSIHARCAALCYPYTLDLDGSTAVAEAAGTFKFANPGLQSIADVPDMPIFVARAGQDTFPGVNESIDRFVVHALRANRPITFVNHPNAAHAFDLFDDSAATRAVIRRVLQFLIDSLA